MVPPGEERGGVAEAPDPADAEQLEHPDSFDPGVETGYLRRGGRDHELPVEIGAAPFDPGPARYDDRRARRIAKRKEKAERKRRELAEKQAREQRERENAEREQRERTEHEGQTERERTERERRDVERAGARRTQRERMEALRSQREERERDERAREARSEAERERLREAGRLEREEREREREERKRDERDERDRALAEERERKRAERAERDRRDREAREERARRARGRKTRGRRRRAPRPAAKRRSAAASARPARPAPARATGPARPAPARRPTARRERPAAGRKPRAAAPPARPTPRPKPQGTSLRRPTLKAGLAVAAIVVLALGFGALLGLPLPLVGGADTPASATPDDPLVGIDPGTPVGLTKGPYHPVVNSTGYGEAAAKFHADRGGRKHEGQDIFGRPGTPLVAVRDAIVLDGAGGRNFYSSGGGNTLVLYSQLDNRSYVYLHMLKPALVKSGETVKAGQLVGQLGCTGSCDGPHLHFEVRNGRAYWGAKTKAVDPLPLIQSWQQRPTG